MSSNLLTTVVVILLPMLQNASSCPIDVICLLNQRTNQSQVRQDENICDIKSEARVLQQNDTNKLKNLREITKINPELSHLLDEHRINEIFFWNITELLDVFDPSVPSDFNNVDNAVWIPIANLTDLKFVCTRTFCFFFGNEDNPQLCYSKKNNLWLAFFGAIFFLHIIFFVFVIVVNREKPKSDSNPAVLEVQSPPFPQQQQQKQQQKQQQQQQQKQHDVDYASVVANNSKIPNNLEYVDVTTTTNINNNNDDYEGLNPNNRHNNNNNLGYTGLNFDDGINDYGNNKNNNDYDNNKSHDYDNNNINNKRASNLFIIGINTILHFFKKQSIK